MPSTRAQAPAAGKPVTGRPPLKNPLRTPAIGATASSSFPVFDDEPTPVPVVSAPQLRKMAISEFSEWLRTQTNKNKVPYRFENVRAHAIIRMLIEGVRREELAQMETGDLPENLIASPFVRVVPLKGARASSQGRLVPLSLVTARALAAYLRVRRSHRYANLPALWLGSRNRGPMTASGVYQMLHRRAPQAGYAPIVRPHQFRHTFANDWLEGGGSEGDLMRLMGWKTRSMVDRYAQDMQVARAVKAKRARGDMY